MTRKQLAEHIQGIKSGSPDAEELLIALSEADLAVIEWLVHSISETQIQELRRTAPEADIWEKVYLKC